MHSSDSVEQLAIAVISQLLLEELYNQKLFRVSNKKQIGVTKKTNFSGSAMKGAACYSLCNDYMARMYMLWIDAGMRNLPAKRLNR